MSYQIFLAFQITFFTDGLIFGFINDWTPVEFPLSVRVHLDMLMNEKLNAYFYKIYFNIFNRLHKSVFRNLCHIYMKATTINPFCPEIHRSFCLKCVTLERIVQN